MYRVLIVDDEPIERMMLVKMLQKAVGDTCTIYEAKNGREAVEVFEKEKIQIAILDIEMPGINGLEAAKVMRELNEACVIIFITAFDNFSYAKQAISVRAIDYILKPYENKEVVYAVEEGKRLIDKYYHEVNESVPDKDGDFIEENIGDIRLSLARETIENYIKAHYMDDISMHDLAHVMKYSDAHFCKLFKQCFKVNFTAYLTEYRIGIAKKMLEDPRLNIKDIGNASGYTDSNYFARVFKRSAGCTPTEYRTSILVNRKVL